VSRSYIIREALPKERVLSNVAAFFYNYIDGLDSQCKPGDEEVPQAALLQKVLMLYFVLLNSAESKGLTLVLQGQVKLVRSLIILIMHSY
jgi:hypothetical protein